MDSVLIDYMCNDVLDVTDGKPWNNKVIRVDLICTVSRQIPWHLTSLLCGLITRSNALLDGDEKPL